MIGTRGIKNTGVDIEMAITVARTWTRHRIKDLYESGIIPSTASISLLKRLIIRPTGVCSKKLILLRKIENSMEL